MPRAKRYPIQKANLHVSAEMNERIAAFRFEQKFKTEADAIRELIRLGLAAAKLRSVMSNNPAKSRPKVKDKAS